MELIFGGKDGGKSKVIEYRVGVPCTGDLWDKIDRAEWESFATEIIPI